MNALRSSFVIIVISNQVKKCNQFMKVSNITLINVTTSLKQKTVLKYIRNHFMKVSNASTYVISVNTELTFKVISRVI